MEFSGNGLSLVMIPENEEPVCYKLPVEYSEWAMTVVGMANMGENIFQGEAVFSFVYGQYYVDII